MPIATVQLPNGKIADIEIPQGATPQEIESFVMSQPEFAQQPSAPQAPEVPQPAQEQPQSFQDQIKPYRRSAAEDAKTMISAIYSGAEDLGTGIYQTAADLGVNFSGAKKVLSMIRPDLKEQIQSLTSEDISQILADKQKVKNAAEANNSFGFKAIKEATKMVPFLAAGSTTGKVVSEGLATGGKIAQAVAPIVGLSVGGGVGGAEISALSPQEKAGLGNRTMETAKGAATGAAFGTALGVGSKLLGATKPISKFTSSLIDRVRSELGNNEVSKKIATEQLKSGLAKEGVDISEALKQTSQEGKDLVDILDPRFATLNKGLKNLNRPETIKIADQSLARITDTTNKLQNKIVNLISDKKISPDQAGEILGRNSQKIFTEALQARRAKAAPLYRRGLESGTKVDLNTVLTQNTAEISDLLGVEGKELTLKSLLNSPVIQNSISQARAKSLEFAKSPAEDIYGRIYQKTKPVYKTITERKDIISNPITQRTDGFYSPMQRNVDLGAAARDIVPEYSTKTVLAKPAQYKIPDNDIRVLHAVDNILYDRISEIAQTGASKEQTALGIVRKSIGNLLDNSNSDLAKARNLWRKDTENLAFAKNSLIGKYAKYYNEGRTDELAKAAMNILDLPTNKIAKARQANPQEFSELLRFSIENRIASIQPLDDGVINPRAFTKAFFSDSGKNLEAAVGGDKAIVKGFKNLVENLDIRFQKNKITKSAMESQARSVRIPTGKTSAVNRVFEFIENRLVSSPEVQREFVNGLFTSEGQQMLRTIASSEKKVQKEIVDNFMQKIVTTNLATQSSMRGNNDAQAADTENMTEEQIRNQLIQRQQQEPLLMSGINPQTEAQKIKKRYYR
jgi:hypothetical protein